MEADGKTAGRALVKEIRDLTRSREPEALQQAVLRLRNWMDAHPNDLYVGTALEEFEILEEAARSLAEARNTSPAQVIRAS